jgi:hypothetical protein
LPENNFWIRITERGSDGCATKIQGFDTDVGEDGDWIDLVLEPSEQKYMGMPGQLCPEAITVSNPCYFFTGTNYVQVPCK